MLGMTGVAASVSSDSDGVCRCVCVCVWQWRNALLWVARDGHSATHIPCEDYIGVPDQTDQLSLRKRVIRRPSGSVRLEDNSKVSVSLSSWNSLR